MKDDFVKICKTSDVVNKRGKKFQLDDETEIAVFKVDGIYYAVDNVCPHNHAPIIYDGFIDDMHIACPIHGFRFHLETGKQPTGMGGNLRIFEVKTEGENLYVKKPDKKLFDFDF